MVRFCILFCVVCCCVEVTRGSDNSSSSSSPPSPNPSSVKSSATARHQNTTLSSQPAQHHHHHHNHQPHPHHQKIKQRKIVVSTVLEEPYVMLRQGGMFLTGNERFHGYLVDLLNKISTNLGFQHEIRLSRDGKHGDLVDGKWDGSIGEVISEAADIAAGPLIVDEQKHHYVDFTEPFLTLRSSALIRRPNNIKNKTTGEHSHNQVPTMADELFTNMDYIVGVLRDGPAQKSISVSSNPIYRTAWARATSSWPSGIVDSIQEGIERARRENFAFIVDSPIAEYVAGRRPCDLLATEPFLDSIKYALILRKGDRSLRQSLDRSLRQMRDNSELQALYLRWWKDECKRFHSSTAVKRSNSTISEQKTPSHQQVLQQPSPAPKKILPSSYSSSSSSGANPRLANILLLLIFMRYIHEDTAC